MVLKCAYPGCPNREKPASVRTIELPKEKSSKEILSFHRFPVDDSKRLKLWLLAVHRDVNFPLRYVKQMRLCSVHFPPDDFKPSKVTRRYLKSTAVPTLFFQNTQDNPNDPRSTDDPEILQDTVTWLNRFFFVRCSSVNASETKKDRN